MVLVFVNFYYIYSEFLKKTHFLSGEKNDEIRRCIGVFLCFTAKRMVWVVKENGQSWDGDYFRGTILIDNVMLFLKNPENVMCSY